MARGEGEMMEKEQQAGEEQQNQDQKQPEARTINE
jgi:hypothetical protein